MDAAAHNIANVQTPHFQRQEVRQSQEASGVMTTVGQSPEIGPDLAKDLVEQKSASYQYKANLRTVQTEDQMLGSLLDVKA
jgi:flagellar hook protein FlgE